jgi:hypothetical protein
MHKITILYLLFFLLLADFSFAQSKALPEYSIEGYFTLRYSSFNTDITTYIIDDLNYLPLTFTLSFLRIYHNPENDYKRISGFFINQSNTFVLDFEKNTFEIDGVSGIIDTSEYYIEELDVFVSESFWEKVFKIQVTTSMLTLKILLESNRVLPIRLAVNRENDYRFVKGYENVEHPLIYGREFTIFNAGVLSYDVSYDQRQNNLQSSSYNFGLGSELLGGAFTINTYGNYDYNQNINRMTSNYILQYHFEYDYLKQFTIGHIQRQSMRNAIMSTMSIRDEPLLGVMFTNESPLVFMDHFTDIKLRGFVGNNWQSEVYLNESLYSHGRSGTDGYYNFEVPINYGMSRIKIKHYGPSGEIREQYRNFNILQNFISPGDLKYTFWGGRSIYSDDHHVNGDVSVGIFNWLTNSTRINYIHEESSFAFFNQVSARLYDNVAFSVGFNPSAGVNTSLIFNSVNNYITLNHSNPLKSKGLSGIFDLSRTDFYISLNRLLGLPLSLNLSGSHQIDEDNQLSAVSSSLIGYLGAFTMRARYRGSYMSGMNSRMPSHFVEMSAANYFNSIKEIIPFIDFLRAEATTSYDLTSKSFFQSSGRMTLSFLKYLNLYTYITYNHQTQNMQISAGLSFNTPYFRTNSRATYDDNQINSVSNRVQGSVAFESESLDLTFSSNNRYISHYGISSARLRFFKDNNNNGKMDLNEPLVEGIRIRMDSKSGSINYQNKAISVINLIPNFRYNVEIEMTSLPDPVWIPKHTKFSFISDANSTKLIDVPLLSSGIIEGSIKRIKDNEVVPQNRVRIKLTDLAYQSEDNIFVFNDGSFYKMGVLPGKYRAQVDSMQMAILKVKSVPEFFEFEVTTSEFGDLIPNLNFVLLDADSIDSWQKLRNHMITMQINKLKEYENSGNTDLTTSGSMASTSNEQTVLPHSGKIIDVSVYDDFLKGFNKDAPKNAGMIEGKILYDNEILTGEISDFNVYIEGIDNNYQTKSAVFGDGSYFGNGLPPGKYKVYPAINSLDKLKCKAVPAYKEIEISNNPIGDVVFNVSFKLIK